DGFGIVLRCRRDCRAGRSRAIYLHVHIHSFEGLGGTTARVAGRRRRAFSLGGVAHAAASVKKAMSFERSATQRPFTFFAGNWPFSSIPNVWRSVRPITFAIADAPQMRSRLPVCWFIEVPFGRLRCMAVSHNSPWLRAILVSTRNLWLIATHDKKTATASG